MLLETARRLRAGQHVTMTAPMVGENNAGEEVENPPGTVCVVTYVRQLPAPQGFAIDLQAPNGVYGTYDESDRPAFPFVLTADSMHEAMQTLWTEARAMDDRLNEGTDDEGPQPPDGDSYNELFGLVSACLADCGMPPLT